jgi:hypothetical protein
MFCVLYVASSFHSVESDKTSVFQLCQLKLVMKLWRNRLCSSKLPDGETERLRNVLRIKLTRLFLVKVSIA